MNIKIQKSENLGNFLFFEEVQFDEETGIETTRKVAAKRIMPGFDPAKALAAAKSREWKFTGSPDRNGFYQVSEVTADELVHTEEA